MCDMTELRAEIASCAVYSAPIAFRLGAEQQQKSNTPIIFNSQLVIESESPISILNIVV